MNEREKMTEERKQELRQLLEEAMDNLEIRPFGGDGSVVQPLDEYKRQLYKRWTFYSECPPRGTVEFLPYIVNEATKSKLLDFIRAELAPFIHEDKILAASRFLLGGPNDGYPLNMLLEQLLRIAIVRGIDEAVLAFDRCTKDNCGSFQCIVLLAGINPRAKIQVFEGIKLVPLSQSKSDLPHYLPDLSDFYGISADSVRGKTLLIIDHIVSPVFHRPFPLPASHMMQEHRALVDRTFQAKINSSDLPKSVKTDFSGMYFCQALSLACNIPVQATLEWDFLEESELFNLSGTRATAMRGWGIVEYYNPWQSPTELGKVHIEETKRLYKILVNLNSNVSEKLHIPIERWVKSKVSINPTDKIIDSIIALEALYVTSKAKIGKKLRHRASWYLGENPAHQQELETELEAIYDYRSDVVHSRRVDGKIQVGNQSVLVSDLSPRVEDLCRQSIIRIMEDGKFPDWNTLRRDSQARWARN